MPLRRDRLGNEVTASSDRSLAGIDDFVGGLLACETRAGTILATAAADPGCCLANTYAAALAMLLEVPDGAADAAAWLAQAERSAAGATERERMLLRFVTLWQQDDIAAARRLGETIAGTWPADLALVKLHQYLSFNLGDAPAMLRIARLVEPVNRNQAHFHGMLAFALEQCHLIDAAEAAAERALALRRREPWAQHALAHVALTRGRIDAGAAFLESVEDTWQGLNSFMLTHLWWHRCLFHLSQGRLARVLALYDERCWGVDKACSQDQIGAVSLLARLELAGADVGDRWQELADHLACRATDTVQPLLSLHYLYGLARAGRPEADRLLRAIAERARPGSVWLDVALPAARGLAAQARGDHAGALAGLEPALPRLAHIGGSHAQRDLFEQFHLDALIRSGRLSQAQSALELRRRSDPDGVPLNRALACAYAGLGLPREAAEAAQRAATTEASHPP